jgi:hypothetical protein
MTVSSHGAHWRERSGEPAFIWLSYQKAAVGKALHAPGLSIG